MHLRWINFVNNKLNLILGSSSIQRKQLLTEMGFKYEIIVPNFLENLPKKDAKSYVEETCYEKLNSIINDNKYNNMDIVVTSDCIVELDNKILEKADDEKEAINWIVSYSNKKLKVYSSVCIALIKT